jgi:hypothetical protein
MIPKKRHIFKTQMSRINYLKFMGFMAVNLVFQFMAAYSLEDG